MTYELPFPTDGAWLRCALHAHTTSSDGDLPPEKLVAHYERAGFDVLAITDHWVRTEHASTERLLVIPSVELNATLDGTGSDAHVLAIGVEADPVEPGRRFPNLADTVAWIADHGGVPYLAHTYWSGLRHEELDGCDGLVGIEVYNAGCELEVGRGLSSVHWDETLEKGRPLLAIATDDSHHPGFDSGFAWVWARCAERSREAVLAALRDGSFYSSSGPEIHGIVVADGEVEVTCSPAASVTLVCGRASGSRVNAGRLGYQSKGRILSETPAGEIVAARLERSRYASYGRVEVADALGRKAWSNPLWLAGA